MIENKNIVIKRLLGKVRTTITDWSDNNYHAGVTSTGRLMVDATSTVSGGISVVSPIYVRPSAGWTGLGFATSANQASQLTKATSIGVTANTIKGYSSISSTKTVEIRALASIGIHVIDSDLSDLVSIGNSYLSNIKTISSVSSSILGDIKSINSTGNGLTQDILDKMSTGVAVDLDISGLATQATLSSAASDLSELRSLASSGLWVNGTFWQTVQPVYDSTARGFLSSGLDFLGTIRTRTSTAIGLLSTGNDIATDILNKLSTGVEVNLDVSALATQATLSSAVSKVNDIHDLLSGGLTVNGTFWQAVQPTFDSTACDFLSSAVGFLGTIRTEMSTANGLIDGIKDKLSTGVEVNLDVSSLATQATLSSAASDIGTIKTSLSIISANPKFYEDTSFVVGDSPVTLDFNNDLGRNATFWSLVNDGPGDITVDITFNGSTWETGRTLKCMDEPLYIPGSVDSIKLTWVSNSAYRCWAI